MQQEQQEVFTELALPRKTFSDKEIGKKYRVYKNRVDFIIVEADTALEAIRKSLISKPHKVVRESLACTHILSEDKLSDLEDPNAEISETNRIRSALGSDVSGLIETADGTEALTG